MGTFDISRNATLVFTCAAATMLIGAVVTAKWHQRSKKKSVPKKWRRVGEISEIFIYPLKSGEAVKVDKGECTNPGLKTTNDHPLKLQDRSFIIFGEENGVMKTARQYPHMVLIKMTSADGVHATFEAPDMPILKITLPQKPDESSGKKICSMWVGETAEALDCGDEAAEWMSTYIIKKKSGLRLGYHLVNVLERRDFSKPPRFALKKYYDNLEANDSGIYSDLSSFMMMTEASVQDVKDRIANVPNLTPKQFRPNFVVRGTKAFDEDKWDWVRVGDDVIMRAVKPCTRCIFTTIDPETGIKDKNMEPLKTLRAVRPLTDLYAKETGDNNSPVMGLNLGLRSANGIVRVGDPVYVGA